MRSSVILVFGLLLMFEKPVKGHEVAQSMTNAAEALVESLSEVLQKQIQFGLTNKERKNWHFVPKPFEGRNARKGVPLADMDDEQKELAMALLHSGLSHRGFQSAKDIIALEQILWELEQQNMIRDTGRYYISIFGKPGDTNWGWRFEGHHLSVNFTIVDKKVISASPNFFASNPAEVTQGERKGLRVLAAEEDLARNLVQVLSPEQLKTALLSKKPPRDILTRAKPKVDPLEGGISYAQLTNNQQEMLRMLALAYIGRVHPKVADEKWREIEKSGLEKIKFGWAGGMSKGQPHYYRVQGSTFLFEYANTQNNANHVHSVWREFDGDFGEDVLRKHFAELHK